MRTQPPLQHIRRAQAQWCIACHLQLQYRLQISPRLLFTKMASCTALNMRAGATSRPSSSRRIAQAPAARAPVVRAVVPRSWSAVQTVLPGRGSLRRFSSDTGMPCIALNVAGLALRACQAVGPAHSQNVACMYRLSGAVPGTSPLLAGAWLGA